MADRPTLTRVFAPGNKLSSVLLVLALGLTVVMFHCVNGIAEQNARDALQVPAAKQVLQNLKPHDAQPGPLDTESPYALAAAWGVFDPLANRPVECTDDAPLVALLKGLSCIETAFRKEALQLPEKLQMASVCNFETFAFGVPMSSIGVTRSPPMKKGIDAVMDKLVQTVLGVEPASPKLGLLGLRSYARDHSLGAEVSVKNKDSVRAAWADPHGPDLGLLYWIYVAQEAPDALRANPACRALRDGFDGFAEKVLNAHRRAQEAVALQRWTLRSLNGPLQFAMVVLFFWGMLRLGARRLTGRWAVPPAKVVLFLRGALIRGDQLISSFSTKWTAKRIVAFGDTAHKVVDWAKRIAAHNYTNIAGADWSAQIATYGDAGSAEAAITAAQDISEKALERWLAEVIPMLGFLGTVIGMILAMERVGDVVAARPGVELDAAMDGISGALSVAFFTTFIGLVASLILILVQGLQAAWEHDRIRMGLQASIPTPSENNAATTKESAS